MISISTVMYLADQVVRYAWPGAQLPMALTDSAGQVEYLDREVRGTVKEQAHADS